MGAKPDLTQPQDATATKQKGTRKLVSELKAMIRQRTAAGTRQLSWSVHIGDLTDVELEAALAALARLGYKGTFEREYARVAHFELRW